MNSTFELLDDPFAFYNLTGFLSERIEYGSLSLCSLRAAISTSDRMAP